MKKVLVIVLAVLAVAGAGLIVGNHQFSAYKVKVKTAHDTVLNDYNTLVSNAQNSSVTVTEGDMVIGTYSLSDLGILDSTVNTITAKYSIEDRTRADIFDAESLQDKIAWNKGEHPAMQVYPVNMAGYTDAAFSRALAAISRTASENAYPVFNGHGYEIVDAVPGNELDSAAVLNEFRKTVEAMTVGAEVADAKLDIAELGLYLPPEITAENQDFDLDAMLRDGLKDVSFRIDLNLDGETLKEKILTVSGEELSSYVSLDRDNNIKVDEKGLRSLTAGWESIANAQNVEYILDSFVDGPKPISFLKANYTLDSVPIAKEIAEHLKALEGGPVDAQFICTDTDGEPFPLGEKFIEIDIDNQHMTFHDGDTVIADTDVVTGNLNGFQTITGLYFAYNKDTDITMKGDDYCVFSEYWIGIQGEYGIHDASWRKHFGWDFYVNGGSHGCVNVPCEAMPEFFENAEVGTPILIYGKNRWYQPDPEVTLILQDPTR